jgi:hypothetical protein
VSGNEERFFFVHIMKTGGATLRRHIEDNFPGAVYPDAELDRANLQEANMLVSHLLQLSAERHAAIRAYTGHFPYVATRLLDMPLTTLSLLREPVARTISYLKHCKRYQPQHRDLALEAIYEDPFFYPTLIHNHQTKIFAMTEADGLESYMDVIPLDERRFRVAAGNLEEVDVLGVHERHDDFLEVLQHRFGWRFRRRGSWRVSEETWDVPSSFRRRIAEDNDADVALYEHARSLLSRRSRVS